nr:MBL fold metallo-hydrolase [Dehalobacterium formicoaceticum]
MVTKCYNTCFALWDQEEDQYFLSDAGGGNGILSRFAGGLLDAKKLHHAFITHKHTDHMFGIFWVMREIAGHIFDQSYQGNFYIYCHEELAKTITAICSLTLSDRVNALFGERILILPVQDGETKEVFGNQVTFFDLGARKCLQYGFTISLKNSKRLTFLGDEPYRASSHQYVQECDWLLAEALCLAAHGERYRPWEIEHSTVVEVCQMAEEHGVKNLVLWHTEDDHLDRRKELYTQEGRGYFSGRIFVPDDLERIRL